MKKFYMVLGAALMMSGAVFAQHSIDEYYLSASDVNIEEAGGQGTTTISLTAPEVMANVTFYLDLPEGIEVAWDDDADDWAIAGCEELLQVKGKTKHTITADEAAKGFMVVIYNDKGDTPIGFNKESGDLCKITFEASNSIANGEYEVKIIDIDMDNTSSNVMQQNGWSSKNFNANGDTPIKVTIGPATGIESVNASENLDNAPVYDLNGRMLNGKPAQKGIYIRNGKKIVIK